MEVGQAFLQIVTDGALEDLKAKKESPPKPHTFYKSEFKMDVNIKR